MKWLAGATAAYALSPIDLIPDFIPVLGYLDDLLIVPACIWLIVRLIPPPLLTEFRREADLRTERPTSYLAAAFIGLIWILAIAGFIWLYIQRAGWPLSRSG